MYLRVVPRIGIFDVDEFFVLENDKMALPELLEYYSQDGTAGVAFNRLVSTAQRSPCTSTCCLLSFLLMGLFRASVHCTPTNEEVSLAMKEWSARMCSVREEGSCTKEWVL